VGRRAKDADVFGLCWLSSRTRGERTGTAAVRAISRRRDHLVEWGRSGAWLRLTPIRWIDRGSFWAKWANPGRTTRQASACRRSAHPGAPGRGNRARRATAHHRRLAGVLPRPDRPRTDWSLAGDLRCALRAGGRDRRDHRRRLSVPHSPRGEPDERDPEGQLGWVRAMLHSIYDQPDDEAVHAHFDRFIQALAEKLPRSPSTSRKLGLDVLAFTVFPRRSGARSGPTTPASTARSAGAQNCHLGRFFADSVLAVTFFSCGGHPAARKVDRQATGAYGYFCW
jgi:hypothetical protein